MKNPIKSIKVNMPTTEEALEVIAEKLLNITIKMTMEQQLPKEENFTKEKTMC